mmetsp:Transcript_39611/g.119716  ORF Transcript_39611/g.119716 Transcript_39611/m.119716 type:complete len:209 (-) Transcript_39611:1024-1650(-)
MDLTLRGEVVAHAGVVRRLVHQRRTPHPMDFGGAAGVSLSLHVPHGHGVLLGEVPQPAAQVNVRRFRCAAASLLDHDPGVLARGPCGIPHDRYARRHAGLLSDRPPKPHDLGHHARHKLFPKLAVFQVFHLISGHAYSSFPLLPRLLVVLNEAVQGSRMRLHAALHLFVAARANALALPEIGAPLCAPPRQERIVPFLRHATGRGRAE